MLVVGDARPARRVLAQYLAVGAEVFHLGGPLPERGRAGNAEHAGAAGRAGNAEHAGHAAQTPIVHVHTVQPPRSPTAWSDLVSAVELVVLVEATAQTDALITAACLRHRTWLTREPAAETSAMGSVTLVGGGPGSAGLLTVAAMDALRRADVVFYDRLGPSDLLEKWAPGAELVDVGKAPGHHARPQREIERMLVAAALRGDTVVRLKGGDPFVFGRGGEEVIACREAGVAVTVIPGVTSAIAVPAAAGIPVTHRGVSRLFTVISGHTPIGDRDLTHLIGLGGTIVVLMGISTLGQMLGGLSRLGMRADMPVAIIERGFADDQRTTICSLDRADEMMRTTGVRSPAVVVIGDVVTLAARGDEAADALLREAAQFALFE
ncbi:uroporphyrin-III C-methyltransferase [Glaciihabitans tibetensis]|uniref:uroporphyrinogen-III C-methyltransferase n=1 Tax=Glaciihabitans tibetensis TaxID=1266600 RepID=A0A2T0VBU2_9MICO|nr:uroporphyrin-III C-methyltransferase [Glaciihabitans tibetensis]